MAESIIPPRPAAVQGEKNNKAAKGNDVGKPSGASVEAPDVKALQGKTTVDDKVSIEAEILAYSAISKIAKRIASEFHSKFPDPASGYRIIVLDDSLVAALTAHQTLVMELDLISNGFARVIEAGTPSAAAAKPGARLEMFVAPAGFMGALSGTAMLGRSLIDLLSLFRQDTSYYGRSYTVNDSALVLEVVRYLKAERGDIQCIYPKLLLYRPGAAAQTWHGRFKRRLTEVYDLRDRADRVVADLSKSCLELQLKIQPPAPRQPPSDSELTEFTSELIAKKILHDSCEKLFDANDAKLSQTVNGLSTPDAKGVTPLEIIQKAEEIVARFEVCRTNTFLLYVQAVDLAGNYRIRSNLWRTLWNSDGLSYSGGAIVTFGFLNGDAELVLCGTHRWRTPFVRFSDRGVRDEDENSF
jgi:hypothetical protein